MACAYIYIYICTSIVSRISFVHVFDATVCLYMSLPTESQVLLFPKGCLVFYLDFQKQLLCGKDHWELGRQMPLSLWKARKTQQLGHYLKPDGTVVVMMLPKASVHFLPKTDAFIRLSCLGAYHLLQRRVGW